MYGRTASGWELADGRFTLRVVIPPNATATVRIPDAAVRQVTESGAPIDQADGVTSVGEDGGDVVVEIGSGAYTFVADRR